VLIVKRFPHYDFGLMGERAARLIIRTVRGSYEPVLEVRRPNIAFATVYGGTHQGVPRDMMERARRWENRRPDVYVSVAMGFPFADVPDMGMSVFVQTNGDRAVASEIADDMAQYIWNRRDEFEYDIPKLSEGVEQGLVALDAGKGPLVLANLSDRLGDATHILGQLLERGRSNFVVATIEDASAIETIKKDYAVGDAIEITIGGHTSELAGAPVVIDGVVSFIGAYDIGGSVESDLVALSFGDNNWVLLTPDRYQVTTRSILDHAGVPVDEMDIFVVKSRNHFRRGFMETGLAKTAVVIDAPGHGPADIGQLQFQNLPEGTYSRFLSE
jgi:microcystin degradation protein MlrC